MSKRNVPHCSRCARFGHRRADGDCHVNVVPLAQHPCRDRAYPCLDPLGCNVCQDRWAQPWPTATATAAVTP